LFGYDTGIVSGA
jgi:SP family myo-inositol transporter-like MFS transporter 13